MALKDEIKQTKAEWTDTKNQIKADDRKSILQKPRKSIFRAEEDYENNGRKIADLHTLIRAVRKNRYGADVLDEDILKQDLDKRLWRKTQLLVNYGLWRDDFQGIFVEKDRREWDTGFDVTLRHHTQRAELIFELVQVIQKHTGWGIDGHLDFLRVPEIVLDLPLDQGVIDVGFEFGKPFCGNGLESCQGCPNISLSLKKTTPGKGQTSCKQTPGTPTKITQEALLQTDFVADVKEILAQYQHHKVLEGTGIYWAKNHEEQPMTFVGIVMKALGLDLKCKRETIDGEQQRTRTLDPTRFAFMKKVTYRLNCRIRDGSGTSPQDEEDPAQVYKDLLCREPLPPSDYEVPLREVDIEQSRLFNHLYEEGDDPKEMSRHARHLAYYSICGVSP